MKVIIKFFSEICIKSKYVRNSFAKKLFSNIKNVFKEENILITRNWDNIILESENNNYEYIKEKLKFVSGIARIYQVLESDFKINNDLQNEENFNSIGKFIINNIDIKNEITFAIKVKRNGIHNFKSVDIERYLGGCFLKKYPNLKVNLGNPDIKIKVEIKDEKIYLIVNEQKMSEGFPSGTQDKIMSLISGGYDSAVSSHMMINRGCKVDFLFFNIGGDLHKNGVLNISQYLYKNFSYGYKSKFFMYDLKEALKEIKSKIKPRYQGVVLKRVMLIITDQIIEKSNHKAIVTGESIGQVSSQTLSNLSCINKSSKNLIIRPLITMDKTKIINHARRIGTDKISEKIPEYCAMTNKNPATDSKIEDIKKEELKLDFKFINFSREYLEVIDLSKYIKNNNKDEVIEEVNTLDNDDILIDLREEDDKSIKINHNNVLNINYLDSKDKIFNLDKDKKYLLYCERGIMSSEIYKEMKNLNFNVKVYKLKK